MKLYNIASAISDIESLLKRSKVDKAVYIYNLNYLKQRLSHINSVFPSTTHHAVAIKTNNLPRVLSTIVSSGCGLEAASFEEVKLAIASGCDPSDVVFDSPVKTKSEIDYCDMYFEGIRINANSFHELEKLKERKNIRIGIRINPMINIDSPSIYNVSGSKSKFGIPIGFEKEILSEIRSNSRIEGLHVHPGSEIKSIEDHIECIGVVYDLAQRMNVILPGRIKSLDIGGGIKSLTKNSEQLGLDEFVDRLSTRCPQLDQYIMITEYGRYIHTECAVVVSRVEDVLPYTTPQTILLHVGADLFLREVYTGSPKHNFAALDMKGILKDGTPNIYDIGGPLCFSGDYLERNYSLFGVQVGDYIVMDKCGSNSISMWSSHCSREKTEVIYVD